MSSQVVKSRDQAGDEENDTPEVDICVDEAQAVFLTRYQIGFDSIPPDRVENS